MTYTEKRSENSETEGSNPIKKISIKQTPEEEAQAKNYFQSHVFESSFKAHLTDTIRESKPYKWGTIKNLINDELLRNVRKEIMNEIQFTKKETDIYKVFQSGDLANLSAMPEDLLKRLPSLYKLRSAIYSETFRNFMSDITNSGKLSGVKTDLSIQLYTKGCHLLTHDDVIGSRRVSFILYMPDPDTTWKPHYGGGLQLFDSIVPNVPKSDVHSKLVPEFNQIAFFTVQPGLSFHAVEEVKVNKQRLSLQGWFHIPQFGEDGYIQGEQEKTESKSTLQQLESKELREFDFPKLQLNEIPKLESQDFFLELSEADKLYLSKFMNISLLTNESILKLNKIFDEESVVDILSFLNSDYEMFLKNKIKVFELNESPSMPVLQNEIKFPWKLAIPSHKQRFMYIDGLSEQNILSPDSIQKINNLDDQELPNFKLTAQIFELLKNQETNHESLKHENSHLISNNEISSRLCELASFFKSISFKKWLYKITELPILKDKILIRRFRPGHDFILATKVNEDDNSKDNQNNSLLDGFLEATLNLTPTSGWENGEWGAYELCMLDEGSNDDNVKTGELNEDEAAIYKSSENNDSVVYESQACFNKLSLMYRDPSVLKFVKYVSFDAPGSRWDLNCTWKCGNDGEEEEEEEEKDKKEGNDK